jgi:hypothetical protein
MSKTPSELIRGGKLRTGTFDVCLDPDLIAEYEDLESKRSTLERLRDAKAEESRESFVGARTTEFDEQLAELDAQLGVLLESMEESTLTLTFQAFPRPEFRAMKDKHPPRKDADGNITHLEDARLGINNESFFDEAVPLALVEPKLQPEDLKTLIEERLTDRQWEDLTTVVWNLNRVKVNIPFSSAGSKKTRNSSPK